MVRNIECPSISGNESTCNVHFCILGMYERVTLDQDLVVSRVLHSTSKVLYEPISKQITFIVELIESNDFDLDTSFSCEDLKIFNFVNC